MLILTRKVGESVLVGDQIKIMVVEVKGRQVRLGVEAPRETKIYRGELFERIQEENSRAGSASPDALREAAGLWSKLSPNPGGGSRES